MPVTPMRITLGSTSTRRPTKATTSPRRCRVEGGDVGGDEAVGERLDQRRGTHGRGERSEVLAAVLAAPGSPSRWAGTGSVAARCVPSSCCRPSTRPTTSSSCCGRCAPCGPETDVIVVDDASPDGTADLAEAAAADLGGVKVLRRTGKRGLGEAYRHGFTIAFDEGYDTIVSMDCDFSHDPGRIPAMLAAVEAGADVVVGSRYVPGGRTVDWPAHRRLLSRWGNRYTARAAGHAGA